MDLSFGASVSTDLHSAEHQGPRLPVMHVPAALRREGKKNGSRLLRPCVTRYKLSLRLEISDFVILTFLRFRYIFAKLPPRLPRISAVLSCSHTHTSILIHICPILHVVVYRRAHLSTSRLGAGGQAALWRGHARGCVLSSPKPNRRALTAHRSRGGTT